MTDDLSFLVRETMRVNELRQEGNWSEESQDLEEFWQPLVGVDSRSSVIPEAPGVFYHLLLQGGTFIIRTLPVSNLRDEWQGLAEHPEDYPTLRLIGTQGPELERLAWFECATLEEAQILHERVGHRRFPVKEEALCNLSDPGFSWWLESIDGGFSVQTRRKSLSLGAISLGPLADSQVALSRWQSLARLLSLLPLTLRVEVESFRLQISSSETDWPVTTLRSLFTEGTISDDLRDIFRLLHRTGVERVELETLWFFLNEVALLRRFWCEIEEELPY